MLVSYKENGDRNDVVQSYFVEDSDDVMQEDED